MTDPFGPTKATRLRAIAEVAPNDPWNEPGTPPDAAARAFIAACSPLEILALLDELELATEGEQQALEAMDNWRGRCGAALMERDSLTRTLEQREIGYRAQIERAEQAEMREDAYGPAAVRHWVTYSNGNRYACRCETDRDHDA